MGNQSSSSTSRGVSGDFTSLKNDVAWPLLFHTTHSENIEIVNDKRVAKRFESFCKGICFSNRPVAINENVFLKFKETSTSWSGVLRFGFTSRDPATIRPADLPRYACPDLTNKPGYWAKALGERSSENGTLLVFHVNRTGDVLYSVNGDDKGVFFNGVNMTGPLWAILDVYGNTISVELISPEAQTQVMNNYVSGLPHVEPVPALMVEPDLSNSLAGLGLATAPTNNVSPTTVRYHLNVNFSPMPFHRLCGKHVHLSSDRTIAIRARDEFCNGYVFTSHPLNCGEKLVVQVLGLDPSYDGGLAFGFTSCDPNTIAKESLPDDSDLLLDRMEYWVVNKDVCRNAEVGDELGFTLTNDGEVRYSRNNHRIATLMHVDRTLPLWPFLDIYGNVQKIKSLGVVPAVSQRLPHRAHSTSGYHDERGYSVSLPPRQSTAPSTPTSPLVQPGLLRSISMPTSAPSHSPTCPSPAAAHKQPSPASFFPAPIPETAEERSPTADNSDNECTVCYERGVNSVLYTCGHMCMCYECAIAVKQDKNGLCPICRQKIRDVIKIYRT